MSEIQDTDEDGNPICGRKLNYRDGHCTNPPGYKTDHEGEGACFSCGGASSGAPKGNLNAMTHGESVPPDQYFGQLEPNQQEFVVDIYQSYMNDAPFGYEKLGKSSEVWLAAVDRHKKLRINGLLADEGLVTTESKVSPDGSIAEKDKEHPLMLAYHRLERDNMDKLRKLDILDDTPAEKLEQGELTVEVSIHNVEGDEFERVEESEPDAEKETPSGETESERAPMREGVRGQVR